MLDAFLATIGAALGRLVITGVVVVAVMIGLLILFNLG